VLIVKAPLGVRVALLPLQVTLAAGTKTGWPFLFCVLSRNELLVIELHFIGRLKTTVMEVSRGKLSALLVGSIDTTTGRGWFEAAAADPAAHTIIPNTASEILLKMPLTVIEPACLPTANPTEQ
jgi:hypothetical protein